MIRSTLSRTAQKDSNYLSKYLFLLLVKKTLKTEIDKEENWYLSDGKVSVMSGG